MISTSLRSFIISLTKALRTLKESESSVLPLMAFILRYIYPIVVMSIMVNRI